MNAMCKTCPRYTPDFVPAAGESWYTAHRCPGSTCENYSGCVRKPWHPLAAVLGLVYNVEKETWENKAEK